MKKIKKLIAIIKQFLNYVYYFHYSINRNVYPYKLIGNKIDPLQRGTMILYKIRGEGKTNEILLKHLLSNKNIVERFQPLDAVKIGTIALEDTIIELPKDRRQS